MDCCVFASLHLHPATMLMGASTRHCLSWNLIPSSWQPNWDLYCSDCLSFAVNYLLPFCTLRKNKEGALVLPRYKVLSTYFSHLPSWDVYFHAFTFNLGCVLAVPTIGRGLHTCAPWAYAQVHSHLLSWDVDFHAGLYSRALPPSEKTLLFLLSLLHSISDLLPHLQHLN